MLGVQRIGKYEVLDHLATGGMGQVYLARATGLGGFERRVVVKTLDPSATEDDDAFVTMFLDEARLLGQLHHQYIAPIYEVGRDEDGRYYLVMDYVHGETAETVWKRANDRDKQLPLAYALTVVTAVATALDYAHSLRDGEGRPLDIVHRDVSLSNVMIGYDGAVKLIDFGIAKAANRVTKTAVGMLKGKLAYLAPEQVVHKAVDRRADIFALGIVLYELTTMTRAFRADSDLLTLERITTGTVPLPSLVVRGYPSALEDIVMCCLQVDPAARYQHAGDVALALERFAAANGLLLGHGAITGPMKQLFSERRRRFARSSSRIKSLDAPVDASEFTPVTPIDELEPRTPVDPVHALEPADSATMTSVNPVVAVEHDETTVPVDVAEPLPPPPPRVRFMGTPPGSEHVRAAGTDSIHRLPGELPPEFARASSPDLPRPIQPSPFSGTALVRRRAPRRMEPYFYVGVAVFLLAVLAAILR